MPRRTDFRVSPGTVSKILWHFTGGPLWDADRNRQGKSPKSVSVAYDALCSIVKTGELRIGSYKEVVKVRLPEVVDRHPKTRRKRTRKNVGIRSVITPSPGW
jgi:hypothetical protein